MRFLSRAVSICCLASAPLFVQIIVPKPSGYHKQIEKNGPSRVVPFGGGERLQQEKSVSCLPQETRAGHYFRFTAFGFR